MSAGWALLWRALAWTMALWPCLLLAQDEKQRTVPSATLAQPPTIDGVINADEWAEAAVAERFYDRRRGGLALDQTVVRIASDATAIYVSFECKDSAPDAIVARETEPNSRYEAVDDQTEDHVEVRLDLFATRQYSGYALFSVNPLGTPSAQFNTGRGKKAEWKGEWKAAAVRTSSGWTAEMAIPWAILDYPQSSRPVDIGINFTRYQARSAVQSIWSQEGPEWKNTDAGTWTGVSVPERATPKVSLLPYVLGSFGPETVSLRAGLDARFTPTSSLTLVGSLFPDFATVEGAVEGITFSRAERFVPERRAFFLEGNDFFDVGSYYRIGRFFYPRRIETFDVGLKAYGRTDPKTAVGLLATRHQDSSETAVVGRVTRNFNETDSVTGYVSTLRTPTVSNTVLAAEAVKRTGKLSTELLLARSYDERQAGAANLAFRYFDGGWYHYVHAAAVDEAYENRLGLTDYTGYRGFYWYDYFSTQPKSGPVREFSFVTEGNWDWTSSGAPFRRGGFGSLTWTMRNDVQYSVGVQNQTFQDELDRYVWGSVTFGATNRFRRLGIEADTGVVGDKPYSLLSAWGSWQLRPKLTAAFSSNLLALSGGTQQHVLTANWELGRQESIGTRCVIRNGQVGGFISYRRAGGAGTEWYLILGDPNSATFRNVLQVKMVLSR